MGETLDLGSRVELVPMDAHFHDITIGLYRRDVGGTAGYLAHTYSRKEGSQDRIAFVTECMKTLGGMEAGPDGMLRFPCGAHHERACRRLFLESVKQDPSQPTEPRPMEILDRKSKLTIRVASSGSGVYSVSAEGESDRAPRRIASVAGGLAKLGDLEWNEDEDPERVTYACGLDHGGLTSLLLVRAPNVRAVLREEQSASSRGVLAAPSQQE